LGEKEGLPAIRFAEKTTFWDNYSANKKKKKEREERIHVLRSATSFSIAGRKGKSPSNADAAASRFPALTHPIMEEKQTQRKEGKRGRGVKKLTLPLPT